MRNGRHERGKMLILAYAASVFRYACGTAGALGMAISAPINNGQSLVSPSDSVLRSASEPVPPTILAITSRENPRPARKRICFARDCGVSGISAAPGALADAPNFLRQTSRARANSLSRSRRATLATVSASTACCFSSLTMRAAPSRPARRCTTLSAKRALDRKLSRSSPSSTCARVSGEGACGASLRCNSSRLYSRRAR